MSARNDFYAGINRYKALIVGTNKTTLSPLRSALKSMGFVNVQPYSSLSEAMSAAKVSSTTHVLFDVKLTDMTGPDFVREIVAANPKCIIVTMTEHPGVDNVFDLLRAGARGFLLLPPTLEGVESVLVGATNGSPISETILRSENRNEAFVNLALGLLFRARASRKDSATSASAAQMYDRSMLALNSAMSTARMFAEGGDDQLREQIIEMLIKKASVEKSRLAAVRKNLHSMRAN